MCQPVMDDFGPHWERKMKTLFTRMDADGDGVITLKDYDLMTDRWAAAGNLNEAEAKEVKHGFSQLYRKFIHPDGHDTDFNSFLKFVKTSNKHDIRQTNEPLFARFFPIMDTNDDGFIDEKELKVFFKVIGCKAEDAVEAFKRLDTNHDGQLSKEEFKAAGHNFFLMEEEGDASELMWGPLV